MRIAVVALGLIALISTGVAAQVPAQRQTFLPAHKSRLSIDFGIKQAVKSLPQPEGDCARVKKHRHELLPLAGRVVELPVYPPPHSLKTTPVTPCPVR